MCLQTTIYNFLRIAESSPNEWKTLCVFKRLVLQTRKKPGLVWERVKTSYCSRSKSVYLLSTTQHITLPNKSFFLPQRLHNRVKAVFTWKLYRFLVMMQYCETRIFRRALFFVDFMGKAIHEIKFTTNVRSGSLICD